VIPESQSQEIESFLSAAHKNGFTSGELCNERVHGKTIEFLNPTVQACWLLWLDRAVQHEAMIERLEKTVASLENLGAPERYWGESAATVYNEALCESASRVRSALSDFGKVEA